MQARVRFHHNLSQKRKLVRRIIHPYRTEGGSISLENVYYICHFHLHVSHFLFCDIAFVNRDE